MPNASQELLTQVDAEIIVLGAGIAGITCGITMQSLGYKTTIVSDQFPLLVGAEDRLVSTSYAMASAYPHNLKIKNLERISDDSQSIFSCLFELKNAGIEKQKLFEVYEFEPSAEASPLAERRINFRRFDGKPEQLRKSIDPPYRKDAKYLWGWDFITFFADMPVYLGYLWNLYHEMGGESAKCRLASFGELSDFRDRVFINCTGIGAIDLCQDSSENVILRGKQVLVDAPGIYNNDGLRLAYNYTPTADVFSRADGNPEYVHFFSRSNEWLLGQTRERGKLVDGTWYGIQSGSKMREISGLEIPEQILTVNEDILNTWKNCTIPETALRAREGYRYYRDPDHSGVRLEQEFLSSNLLIHNYGLSGSGITMSWGCALECARMLKSSIGPSDHSGMTSNPLLQKINTLTTN